MRREIFVHFLVNKAREAGAKVLEGIRVEKIDAASEKVYIQAGGREWPGKILVGADGAMRINDFYRLTRIRKRRFAA